MKMQELWDLLLLFLLLSSVEAPVGTRRTSTARHLITNNTLKAIINSAAMIQRVQSVLMVTASNAKLNYVCMSGDRNLQFKHYEKPRRSFVRRIFLERRRKRARARNLKAHVCLDVCAHKSEKQTLCK